MFSGKCIILEDVPENLYLQVSVLCVDSLCGVLTCMLGLGQYLSLLH